MASPLDQLAQDVFVSRSRDKYAELLELMKACPDEDQVVSLLNAIGNFTPQLASEHDSFKELLEMLFSFDWDQVGDDVIEAFESLLIALNLANPGFLEETFKLIVRNFTNPNSTSDRLHDLIKRVLRVNPLGCSALLSVLIDQFPQRANALELGLQLKFMSEVLSVSEFVPVLRERLLGIFFERMLDLDETVVVCTKKMRLSEEKEEESAIVENKLESMLLLLFDYVDKASKKPVVFKALLVQFDKIILRTGYPKGIQFLLFFACTHSKLNCDLFVRFLLECMDNPKEHLSIRRRACSYLAGFLSRSQFVTKDLIQDVSRQWFQRIQDRRELWEIVFQALVYVLIFQDEHKDMRMELGQKWTDFYFENAHLLPLDLQQEYDDDDGKQEGTGGEMLLEFPFDPLGLEVAWSRISPLYRFWQETASDDDEEDDGQEEEDDNDDDDKEEEDDDDESGDDESSSESEEEEFTDRALLDLVLPKAIQLNKIERLLKENRSPSFPPIGGGTRKRSYSGFTLLHSL